LRKRNVQTGADSVEFREGGASVHERAAVRAERAEVSRGVSDWQIVHHAGGGLLWRSAFEAVHVAWGARPLAAQDTSFALGCGVLRRFLGEDWIDRHFAPGGKKGFLTIDESSREGRDVKGFRLIDLAEVLFNLQGAPGFR
jgi:hypothetical protein